MCVWWSTCRSGRGPSTESHLHFAEVAFGSADSDRQLDGFRSRDSAGGQKQPIRTALPRCLDHDTQRVKRQLFIGISYAEKNIHIVIIQAEAKCL